MSEPALATRPAPFPAEARNVLVIKLGALGDFIQAMAAAKVIREYHVGARITLLTTEPFVAMAKVCPYFDVVEGDGRPREPKGVAELIARIRKAKYDCVYDLQTSNRSSNYFIGLKPWPPLWSGIAQGCSHPHANPERENMHTLDRLADQLWFAGIARQYEEGEAPTPDLSWIRAALRDPPRLQPEFFSIKRPYVLIIPGASANRPDKRWPANKYAVLAQRIAARGVTPVLIGAGDEKDVGAAISKAEPRAKNLISRTDLFQVAALAEHCAAAVGNDTGPMHIAAATGAACVVLFGSDSDPVKVAPRGAKAILSLVARNLEVLPVDDVERALRNVGGLPTNVAT
jgi:ADP-heptose:LPS heptosyltransferase